MNGILLVDKPEGWTSHDVVAKLRGILKERRIGHSGTLDPMATGLLVIFVGRATRAVEYAEADKKCYTAGLKLGMVTDTLDTTGNVISETPCDVSIQDIESVLHNFHGEIEQIPPMYSAIKIDGQKLYQLARKGKEVERKARPVTIYDLDVYSGEHGIMMNVCCSKGTYIRSLCHDIGNALGCGGCMSYLRRTRAGAFSVENALSLDAIEASDDRESLLIPVDRLFMDRQSAVITPAHEKKCRNGTDFKTDLPDGEYRIYSESGEFLMLARASGNLMNTIKSFFEV